MPNCRSVLGAAVVIVTALALPPAGTGPAYAAARVASRGTPEMTLYNNDVASVREPLALSLAKGANELELSGFPAKVDSTSVRLEGSGFRVRSQSFLGNLWNTDRVFRRFLGDTIAYRYGGKRYRGLLAGIEGDDLFILRSDSAAVLTMLKRSQISEIEFPSTQAPFQTRPTVRWSLESGGEGTRQATLSYLTSGIEWAAEYSAVLDQDEQNLELTGWATILNRSGAGFDRAKVSLVAGELHQEGVAPDRGRDAEGGTSESARGAELFAYHVYPLDRELRLESLGTVQVPLVGPVRVKARKSYRYDGAKDGSKVRVQLEFENSKGSGLGLPLPEGRLRVYTKEPGGGSPGLAGEDRITHTAAGERVRILTGIAFDLVGERSRVSHTRVSRNVTEDSYKIRVRNHGRTPATVTAVETLYGNWEITQKSTEPRKKDSDTAEFDLEAPAGGEAVLTYTVRYTF